MKSRSMALIIAGIIAFGGFSVLAQEVKSNADRVSVLPMEEVELTYSPKKVSAQPQLNEEEMMRIINEKMEQGNLSPDQVKNMVEYCIEQMGNRLDTDTKGTSGFGCH